MSSPKNPLLQDGTTDTIDSVNDALAFVQWALEGRPESEMSASARCGLSSVLQGCRDALLASRPPADVSPKLQAVE